MHVFDYTQIVGTCSLLLFLYSVWKFNSNSSQQFCTRNPDGHICCPPFAFQFRMTEFGTLEIVTDPEVKGQQAEPNCETLDPAQSHTPTPPPESQSQPSTAAAPTNHSQPGSSQAKGAVTHF